MFLLSLSLSSPLPASPSLFLYFFLSISPLFFCLFLPLSLSLFLPLSFSSENELPSDDSVEVRVSDTNWNPTGPNALQVYVCPSTFPSMHMSFTAENKQRVWFTQGQWSLITIVGVWLLSDHAACLYYLWTVVSSLRSPMLMVPCCLLSVFINNVTVMKKY